MVIEQLRQRLVRECPEFNTVDAFRFLDVRGTGEISRDEFIEGISQLVRATFNEAEADLFIARFSKDGRETLKYSEFCDAIKPKSHSVLSELQQRKPGNTKMKISYDDLFSDDTKDLFRDLWEALFWSES